MRLNISVQSGSGRSQPVDASRLVNMYAEESQGKSPIVLHGTPGLILGDTYGFGPVRGMRYVNGIRYVVSGNDLFTGNGTYLGDIPGSSLVSMADDGNQLVIVNGQNKGYVYSVGGGFVEITDVDFPTASSVDYLDGYFIFSEPRSGRFFISAINDGTDLDALDFATAESAPDDLVRVFVDHREVWLMGTDTCEIWQNTGNVDFPFERISGAINEKGIWGKFTVTKTDNSLFWVDRDGIVRRAGDGYTPQRISTHSIEYQISQGDLDNAEAFSYAQEGHEFYVLTVPNAGTFVFDAATQTWHERKSLDLTRWRACCYARYNGSHFVGDSESGNVYLMDLDTFRENSIEQVAEMVFPPIQYEGKRFRVGEIRLDMEPGTDSSPQVMLSLSKDGKTWKNESWTDFGAIGEYTQRAVWRRLGLHETLHIKFSISDNVKRAVFSAFANIQ